MRRSASGRPEREWIQLANNKWASVSRSGPEREAGLRALGEYNDRLRQAMRRKQHEQR